MKKILNFSDFVLNEIKIQNPEEAINVISKQIDKNEKDKVIREISSEYFSEELLDGSKILKLNDRNQDISVIQSILIALGYLKNKYADGVLDLQTIESIQLIIKDFNLPIIVSDSIPFSFIKFVLEFVMLGIISITI
jgi:hypothetical protein